MLERGQRKCLNKMKIYKCLKDENETKKKLNCICQMEVLTRGREEDEGKREQYECREVVTIISERAQRGRIMNEASGGVKRAARTMRCKFKFDFFRERTEAREKLNGTK